MILYLLSNRPQELSKEKCTFDQTAMMWTYTIDTLEELQQLLSDPVTEVDSIHHDNGIFYLIIAEWCGG